MPVTGPLARATVLRVSKQTDYALVLLCRFGDGGEPRSARSLASETRLPLPIVGKVLKGLARAGLLESRRGVHGGYALARAATAISVADVVDALEGPLAVTECGVVELAGRCAHEPRCAVREPVARLTDLVREALAGVHVADLVQPARAPEPRRIEP